ncbi:hypothetical protein [Corynebacterium pseudodiphtheriticum]|uniref:hypothetical protein n=1 Tax=Corynebacterium pseudodiphtheriticum TaxID=37637 RepID=UPI0025436380|nr:hypothetical protein [Corynebacterium pseudodiphtheriticum]MDK4288753.1 hypothetical protein [Corynebacterium pseudodiphtheriticum]MDK4297298.1 hypothetical protein [Corynebacterium pseudodiphtheriticum]MDK8708211.1 hypothetical protein [Corynebacterium pseudodiphtheriticum]
MLLVVLVTALVWWAGGDDNARPRPFAGDHLGPHVQQSRADYTALADASLAAALQRAPEQPAFAMLSFAAPLSSADAGSLVADLRRVGSLITQDAQILALPEPAADPEPTAAPDRTGIPSDSEIAAARTQIFTSTIAAASGMKHSQIGESPREIESSGIIAVIAYDTPRKLEAFTHDPRIDAVEVLPPDAVWGQFGISPPQVARGENPRFR